jgi:hypothetical protein
VIFVIEQAVTIRPSAELLAVGAQADLLGQAS